MLDERRRKTTELEAFIRDDPVISEFTENPVKYWYAKREDPFARMALDFVSAPGKMPCTHHSMNLLTFFQLPLSMLSALSRGDSLTVSKHRHALSDKSTRASVVLRSWMEAGLVKDDNVIKLFESKANRGYEQWG